MSKKKLTKEEVRQPDTFLTLSEKLINVVEENSIALVSIFALFILAGGGYAAFDFYKKHTEKKSQEAFFEANYWLTQQMEKLQEKKREQTSTMDADGKGKETAKNKKAENANQSESLELEKTPETLERDLPGVGEKFHSVIDAHNGRSGAVSAALTLSKVYSDYQASEKALGVLESVKSVPKASVFYSLFHLRKGELYMAHKQWENAIHTFQKVIEHKGGAFAHPAALLKQGLAYEKKGEAESAEGAYERIIADYKNSTVVESAKVYLKLLKFQKSHQSQ